MNASPEIPGYQTKGTSGLTRNERIALLFFFIMAIGYVIWQFYSRNKVAVDLGEDIALPVLGIVVQVEGAVESPGMYNLPIGARVSDAIEAAGGFSALADRDEVNLAEILEDGQRIDVPRLENSSDSARDGDVGIHGFIINPVEIPSNDETNAGYPELVNINTANQYELQILNGIGEQLALRIIMYRETHGRFQKIEDIMLVDGIAEGKFEDIRDKITVRD